MREESRGTFLIFNTDFDGPDWLIGFQVRASSVDGLKNYVHVGRKLTVVSKKTDRVMRLIGKRGESTLGSIVCDDTRVYLG